MIAHLTCTRFEGFLGLSKEIKYGERERVIWIINFRPFQKASNPQSVDNSGEKCLLLTCYVFLRCDLTFFCFLYSKFYRSSTRSDTRSESPRDIFSVTASLCRPIQ